MKTKLCAYFSICLCLFMLSCKKQKESKTDSIYSYRSYISGTTNGLISAQSNLAIFLQKPIQEPIDQNALRIEPALEGTLHLEKVLPAKRSAGSSHIRKADS